MPNPTIPTELAEIIAKKDAGNEKESDKKAEQDKQKKLAEDAVEEATRKLDILETGGMRPVGGKGNVDIAQRGGTGPSHGRGRVKKSEPDGSATARAVAAQDGKIDLDVAEAAARGEIPEIVLNNLYKLTQLQDSIREIQELINPDLKVLGVIATLYDARVSDDKDILALLKEEYNLVGVVKRLAVAKKGIYDGLAVVEQAPSSEIAKEYTAIAKMIINGNFDREDIENG